MRKCSKCIYYCKRTASCDYYIITETRRGCSVDNCDKFEELLCKRKPPTPVVTPAKPKVEPKRRMTSDDELMPLYRQGMTDAQIAKVTGFNTSTIWLWRTRSYLPSHTHAGRPKKEVQSG